MFLGRKCTNPRDRIYGLLGVADSFGSASCLSGLLEGDVGISQLGSPFPDNGGLLRCASMLHKLSTVHCGLAGSATGLEDVLTPFSHSMQLFMPQAAPHHGSRYRRTRKLCSSRGDRSTSLVPFLLTLGLHCSVTQSLSPCAWRLYTVTGCMNVMLLHLESGHWLRLSRFRPTCQAFGRSRHAWLTYLAANATKPDSEMNFMA